MAVPDPPTGLAATTVSTGQVNLSWDAVPGATGYDLDRDGVIIATDNPTTSFADTGLAPGGSYVYRVRTAVTDAGYNPITALPWKVLLWADGPKMSAVANGATVGTWFDETSNTRDATQATPANQPVMNRTHPNYNGRSAIVFDGVNDSLTSPDFTADVAQPDTHVIIARTNNLASANTYTHGAYGTGLSQGVLTLTSSKYRMFAGGQSDGGTTDTASHLLLAYFNGASSTLTVDGALVTGFSPGTAVQRALRVGANASGLNPLNGSIALVGILARALTTQEQADLRTWSQSYYGTP